MTASERKSMIDRIVSMEGILSRLKERISNPKKDDADQTEYELNRLKTAIHNFKKIQLPKIITYEKDPVNRPGNDTGTYHNKRKAKPVHG